MAAEGATILIVDDEPPIRRLLRTTLAAHEYRIVEAANGAEALSAMRHHRPDLVLLDLGLPDVDGLELIGRLRDLGHVPIVVLSSRGDEAAKVIALDAGADDYVTKPFGAEELMARATSCSPATWSSSGLPAAPIPPPTWVSTSATTASSTLPAPAGESSSRTWPRSTTP